MSLAATVALAASLPLVIAAQPSVRPWPIGPGRAYRPVATGRAVEAGRPLDALTCARGGATFQFHLELFFDRRVIVIPPGIGVASPAAHSGGEVTPERCTYPLWTIAPDGVVEARGPGRLDLAELFRIWGQRLGVRRLATFVSNAPLRAYVHGRRVQGPVGAITPTADAEIVLELGGYVAPHPFFLFSGVGT